MIYEMRRRKPEPILLLNHWIFNLPHPVSMVWEELAHLVAVRNNIFGVQSKPPCVTVVKANAFRYSQGHTQSQYS